MVDVDRVFEELDRKRACGQLSAEVTSADVRYQSSIEYPDLIERLNSDGSIDLGTFKNGVFVMFQRGLKPTRKSND